MAHLVRKKKELAHLSLPPAPHGRSRRAWPVGYPWSSGLSCHSCDKCRLGSLCVPRRHRPLCLHAGGHLSPSCVDGAGGRYTSLWPPILPLLLAGEPLVLDEEELATDGNWLSGWQLIAIIDGLPVTSSIVSVEKSRSVSITMHWHPKVTLG